MNRLRIFSYAQVDAMRERVRTESSISEIYASNAYIPTNDVSYVDTVIEVPEVAPDLRVSAHRPNTSDPENAIKVFEFLGRIDRAQAADPRLWATLTHEVFWDYTRRRWPGVDQGPAFILAHWFEKSGGGLGALRRNAISRLWWAARLTVAPWESDRSLSHLESTDRYKYTRVLLSQSQVFQDVIEREYGSDLRVRSLLLKALGDHLPNVSNRDNLSKAVSMNLLLTLKNLHIEAIPTMHAESVISELVKREVDKQQEMVARQVA